MPDYEYVCARCGAFEISLPMAEATDPQPCPSCGELGMRALARPHLRDSRGALRYRVEARNEKSANEPTIERHLGSMGENDHAKTGGYLGSHGHAHGDASHRPWMVGH